MICEFWLKASINTDLIKLIVMNRIYKYLQHRECVFVLMLLLKYTMNKYNCLVEKGTVMWIIRAGVSLVFKFGSYGFNTASNTSSDMHLEEHTQSCQ